MFNLFKIDFYRLKKSKMFYFLIVLIMAQAAFVYIFSFYNFEKSLHLRSGKEALVYMMGIQSGGALNIIIGVFSADYILKDFTSGYIKNLIYYGHKRINIFISKAVVCYMGGTIISFISPILAGIINTFNNGYGEVFNFNSLLFLIKIFLIMIVIQVAIQSIYILAVFAVKNVNISIGIVILIDIINRIFNIIIVQKPSAIWIVDKFIFSQTNIVLQDNATGVDFLQAGIVSLITIGLSTILGVHVFKRSDIK